MKNNEEIIYPFPIEELEKRINYSFKNIDLINRALTHSSYSNELKARNMAIECNERLEFLGDSVLSVIVSEYIFFTFPDLPEGQLTCMRASAVCEKTLGKLAKDIQLGNYLRLGHGEEITEGRKRISILADAFEAVLAALFIDGGKKVVETFLIPLVKGEIHQFVYSGKNKDYKTLLQQIIQQERGEILEYKLIREDGPDHQKQFEVEARLNTNVIGRGKGKSKREAEQIAAKEALVFFGEH